MEQDNVDVLSGVRNSLIQGYMCKCITYSVILIERSNVTGVIFRDQVTSFGLANEVYILFMEIPTIYE